ncbi:MAG: Ig-like domain-containing protein [Stackebrandtia sp.]
MSELRHAREAKRLLGSRFRDDRRVTGFGIGTDPESGYTVEGRLSAPAEPDLPSTIVVRLDDGESEVPVRWRVTGDINPLT